MKWVCCYFIKENVGQNNNKSCPGDNIHRNEGVMYPYTRYGIINFFPLEYLYTHAFSSGRNLDEQESLNFTLKFQLGSLKFS